MAMVLQTAPAMETRTALNDFAQSEIEDTELSNSNIVGKRITPDEFAQLKIKHAELVDGKVKKLTLTMFSHDRLVTIISGLSNDFVKKQKLGMVASGGSFRTGENQVRVPDVSFVSNSDLEGEDLNSYVQKSPTLAVEVISKNDTYGDVDDKAGEFLAAGSRAVWIVNPRRRTVAVHTPDALPLLHNVGDTIPGGEMLPGLELPIADIFED